MYVVLRGYHQAIIQKISWLLLTAICVHLLLTSTALANPPGYRTCSDTQSCEIGEFLFDDDYTPITTATCTFTSHYPSGNSFIDAEMAVAVDGWYSIDATTSGQPVGLYRSKICCVHQTENLCIDKSFVVASASAQLDLSDTQIADAVWNADTSQHTSTGTFGEQVQNISTLTAADVWSYPSRSLTSFGNLVSDIWSYSSRSLNSVTTLVTSIWSNSTRTLSSTQVATGDNLATTQQVTDATAQIRSDTQTIKKDVATMREQVDTLEQAGTQVTNITIESDITQLSQQVAESRLLLERIANAPIVELFIEPGTVSPPPDLEAKLEKTRDIAAHLSAQSSTLEQKLASLNTEWESVPYQVALAEIANTTQVLGATTDGAAEEPSDIISAIDWLNTQWSSPIITNVYVQANSALSNTNTISREMRSYGKTALSNEYMNATSQHLRKMSELIGDQNDSKETESLYGYINEIQDTSQTLALASIELDQLLERWETLSYAEISQQLQGVRETVLLANKIPQAEELLQPRPGSSKFATNQVLQLKGIIDSNFSMMAGSMQEGSVHIWLEFGSIVFRSLVTNPSQTIEQTVPIKFYLPTEISEEHVIELDPRLTIAFDTERDQYYVSGSVTLNPNQSESFVVEVVDVWVIPEAEIESIRKQTETLFEPLKNTSYFAQGATIKADIEVSLDRIGLLQQRDETPEIKIRSYREALIELQAARQKLEDLKTLVSAAGSVGTLFGFVGGVQTIAVWGLIIILIAGFVFLSLYLKMISGRTQSTQTGANPKTTPAKKSAASSEDKSTLQLVKEIAQTKFKKK